MTCGPTQMPAWSGNRVKSPFSDVVKGAGWPGIGTGAMVRSETTFTVIAAPTRESYPAPP